MPNVSHENYLAVYEDRYELHQNGNTTVFAQGFQSANAKKRYDFIREKLKNGYLDDLVQSISTKNFDALTQENRLLIYRMVGAITSEVGRALVGLTCLQLAIKSIAPEQCVRLHKGSTKKNYFSWVEGISMRTLDRLFNTPFLRKYHLLNINKDGVFMTRSLAENYPYTKLYKAEMRGPFVEWIAIVDAIEDNSLNPDLGLCYLLWMLKNKSKDFDKKAEETCSLLITQRGKSFSDIKDLIIRFFSEAEYSARAFEVSIHAFMQALGDLKYFKEEKLAPLSQMRSANKKHGNIGDIELCENNSVVEAWDAKYNKPYLRDELEELRDKVLCNPDVRIAGFISNVEPDMRDVTRRIEEIEAETGVEIRMYSFDKWVEERTSNLNEEEKNVLGYSWLCALVESFAHKRTSIAPIDEPCDAWIGDLQTLMKCHIDV